LLVLHYTPYALVGFIGAHIGSRVGRCVGCGFKPFFKYTNKSMWRLDPRWTRPFAFPAPSNSRRIAGHRHPISSLSPQAWVVGRVKAAHIGPKAFSVLPNELLCTRGIGMQREREQSSILRLVQRQLMPAERRDRVGRVGARGLHLTAAVSDARHLPPRHIRLLLEEGGHRRDGYLDGLAVQSASQAVERLEGKVGHVENVGPTMAAIAQRYVC